MPEAATEAGLESRCRAEPARYHGRLSNITQEDCDLIDDLMTRYSVYEHSQADDLPAVPPELAQLETDVRSLADWIEGYSKRVA